MHDVACEFVCAVRIRRNNNISANVRKVSLPHSLIILTKVSSSTVLYAAVPYSS